MADGYREGDEPENTEETPETSKLDMTEDDPPGPSSDVDPHADTPKAGAPPEPPKDSMKESSKEPSKDSFKGIETAFLLMLYEDGHLEAATDLPGMKTRRKATNLDIRNMSQNMALDVQASFTANLVAQSMTASIQQAMENQAQAAMRQKLMQSGVVRPPTGKA